MTYKASLLSRVHGLDAFGTVWAIDPSGKRFPVYNVAQLPVDYQNALAAAPLMLRAIDTALPMLDTIGRIFESHDLYNHVVPIMQLEAGLNVARNAALFGYDAHIKR